MTNKVIIEYANGNVSTLEEIDYINVGREDYEIISTKIDRDTTISEVISAGIVVIDSGARGILTLVVSLYIV